MQSAFKHKILENAVPLCTNKYSNNWKILACISVCVIIFFFPLGLEDLLDKKPSPVPASIADYTPPNSDMSSPERSPSNSVPEAYYSDQDSPQFMDAQTTPPYSITLGKDDSNDSFASRGMMDHNRVMLCMFMFAFLTFNPFSFVLKAGLGQGSSASDTHSGRVILSDDLSLDSK